MDKMDKYEYTGIDDFVVELVSADGDEKLYEKDHGSLEAAVFEYIHLIDNVAKPGETVQVVEGWDGNYYLRTNKE